VPGAVISTDADVLRALGEFLASPESGVKLAVRVDVPFTDIGDSELTRIRGVAPEIVFIDLESEPQVGLKFAQYLLESGTCQNLLALGTDLSPELLLQGMQAGILEFIPKPLSREKVLQAVERVWRRTGRKSRKSERSEPGKVLCIFGVKGGAGSTTVSTNLAVEIHRLTRKKVLLLDLDLELGETALQLGVEPRFSVVDLVRNFHRVDADLLASYIETHESGVDILAAPHQPADFEAVSGERIREILRFLKTQYDYVVVDTPKTFNPASTGAFAEADQVFLVTTADIPAIRNLHRSLPLLRSLGGREMKARLRLVVNRYNPKELIGRADIEKTVGLEIFCTLQNDYQSVMASINEAVPAVMKQGSPFGRDVRTLASRITGVETADLAKRGRLGSLFGWGVNGSR
jgi:pilus assembly protein CpaE